MTRPSRFHNPFFATWFHWVAIAFLWMFATAASAAGAISVLADNQRLMLQGNIDYLKDSAAIWPQKLLDGEYDSQFRRYDEPAVNFQDGPVWLRLQIANNTSQPTIVLSLNDVLYTEADLLYNRASEGKPVVEVSKSAGLLQGDMKKNWPYYDIAFALDIPHNEMRTVYLRVHTPYMLLLNPYIADEQTYSLYQVRQAAWGHLMVGIMIGVMMFLIMIAIFVRGIPEVWSCTSFVAISFVILLYGRGYLFPFLPEFNWLKLHLYPIVFSLQAFTYIWFSRQHFDTRRGFPHIDQLLKGALFFTALIMFSSTIIPIRLSIIGVGAMAFIVSILLSVSSVYVWANSERHLTVYIIGTVTFLFICILATLEHIGHIDLGGGARDAYQAGICLQAALFAAALAERINTHQRQQAAFALGAAEAQAENRAKSSFLAKMSHELRTPMNGLLGMLQLLEKTSLTEQQHHYMHVMRNAGRMLLGVIDDVLDYSRIVAGKLIMHESNFNLFDEMSDIETMFAATAQQKNLQLRFSINPNTPPIIHGDAARLRQILVNLISNAIKFTEKGTVTVRLWIEQGNEGAWLLHCEVEDTGIGISNEQLKTLFREYSQVDGGKNYGGSGLGLVICKQLAEMMHGGIHVESAPGYGSAFQFHIAIKPPHENAAQEDNTKNNTDVFLRSIAHVLVVEDNAINSEVIMGMLNQLGYYAEAVTNGEEACNAICQPANHWNLVLMDVEMPVLDGLAAAQKIRRWENAHYRNATPIIALTAHTMRTHGDEILKAGMDDCLSKPIDITLLKSILVRWLPAGVGASDMQP